MNHHCANTLIRGLRQGSTYWKAIPLGKLEGGNTFEFVTVEGIKVSIPFRHPDSLTREYRGQPVYWRFRMPSGEGDLMMTEQEFTWVKMQLLYEDLICLLCVQSVAGNQLSHCEGGQCAFGKLMRGRAALFEKLDGSWRRRSIWRSQHEQVAFELLKACSFVKPDSIVPV